MERRQIAAGPREAWISESNVEVVVGEEKALGGDPTV